MFSRLASFRSYHHLELQDIASKLSISVGDYQLLEEGRMTVDLGMAEKLSHLYHVPIEIFLDEKVTGQLNIIYSHCCFTNCSNGYVSHLDRDEKTMEMIRAVKDQQILLLTEEVQRLREQNNKLIKDLINKLHV